MIADIGQVLESHHCYYEVSPYYIVTEDRPAGRAASVKRVHAGFDVDIYGIARSCQPDPAGEYSLAYNKLKEVVDVVLHENNDHPCSIEVIPFGSTLVLDTRNRLQPMALLRIRITHGRGLNEPAGAAEQSALKAIEAQLERLGIASGRGRV